MGGPKKGILTLSNRRWSSYLLATFGVATVNSNGMMNVIIAGLCWIANYERRQARDVYRSKSTLQNPER